MKNILKNFYKNKNQLYKFTLLIFSICFLVYLFPKKEDFRYQFIKGKKWNYKELKAPFDFSIRKTDQELAIQKDKIKKNKKLYFYKDNKILDEVLNELSILTKDKHNDKIISECKNFILKVYYNGYIDSTYFFTEPKENDLIVVKNKNKEFFDEEQENVAPYGNFYKEEKIKSLINDSFPENKKETNFYNKILKKIIIPDIKYDELLTEEALEKKFLSISQTRDLVYKGEVIISENEIIDNEKFQKLFSLSKRYENQIDPTDSYLLTVGYISLITILFIILFFYLAYFEKNTYINNRRLSFLMINILWICTIATTLLKYNPKLLYAAPICILPLIIRAFFNFHISFIVYFITILILSIGIPNSFEFVFIQLTVGATILIRKKNNYKRVSLFLIIGKVTLAYLICLIGLSFIRDNSLDINIGKNIFIFFFNIISILFSYPLIYLFEKLFNLTSDLSLLELSDTNTPILRMLSQNAPGTLQHSIIVSSLAEESAVAINANPLLARIGAMYHDIGKVKNPAFFTENQHNIINPHNELSSDESVKIILNHVIDGIELGKKYNLPDRVIDFIRTHHGTNLIYFFYKKQKEENPDKEIDKNLFRYPGPKPFSKETAIVMICDAVEAASKSLEKPSGKNLEELVEKIIDYQKEEGQFSNSDITLKEIEIIKHVLKKKLMSIYHTRISYPEI